MVLSTVDSKRCRTPPESVQAFHHFMTWALSLASRIWPWVQKIRNTCGVARRQGPGCRRPIACQFQCDHKHAPSL